MSPRPHLLAAALAYALAVPVALAEPFTFQGYVENAGSPINGNADLKFRIYSAASGGSQIGDEIVESQWPVADGVFTIDLDAGPGLSFDGGPRFLEVEVNGQILNPRLEILAAPLASSSNALRGRAVSASAPASGDVLTWTGSQWVPQAASGASYSAGTGLALAGTTFSVAPGFQLPQGCSSGALAAWDLGAWVCVEPVSAGAGLLQDPDGTLRVEFDGSGSQTTVARSDHMHYGQVWSGSDAESGLRLVNTSPDVETSGLTVMNNGGGDDAVGVYASSNSLSGGMGVWGQGPAMGVRGTSTVGGIGVLGESTATGPVPGIGVMGKSSSPQGRAVVADADNTDPGASPIGLYAVTSAASGIGAYAINESATGVAVGLAAGTRSTDGVALGAEAMAESGATIGVLGVAQSRQGIAIEARNEGASGGGLGIAIRASTATPSGTAVQAEATGNSQAQAIHGLTDGLGMSAVGVLGEARQPASEGVGVGGIARGALAIGGLFLNTDAAGQAGLFLGNVNVVGNHTVSGTKSFRIDHPLDPENRYLLHYNLEGPEPFNLYRGTVKLDMAGAAEVELPEYFEAINIDLSYQLTAVGAAMPNLHVAREVEGNRFAIAGGAAGKRVSWQVTAVRNDPWVRDRGFKADVEKSAEEKGRFLYPEGYGRDETKAIGFEQRFEKPEVR